MLIMLSNSDRIVSISGPTCTGKSDLAVFLAERFGGEIVNCDSMQVYKHFDIGTAKPEESLKKRVPHHLINIVEPQEDFNAARFKDLADLAIKEIRRKKKVPVLVGGTGLYLRALLYGLFQAPVDEELRKRLRGEYAKDSLCFYEKLKSIDPEYAMRISHRDMVRMVRAMEIYTLTGKTVTAFESEHGFREARYNVLKIGLRRERTDLYARINRRVEEMLGRGWVDEVRAIRALGVRDEAKPFLSIGYKEIIRYLNGFIGYEDMVEDIKKFTRHYAKRQYTWFAKERDMSWFLYTEESDTIIEKTAEFLSI